MRKRMTAVAPKRNLLGKLVRGRLSLRDVLAMELLGVPREEFLDLLDRGWQLPMLGGTVSQNTVLANPIYFPAAVATTTDQTIHQGDMVWWDPVNYTLKPLTSVNSVAVGATGGYCGVAQGSNVPNVYPDPAAGTPSEKASGIVVQRGGTVRVNTTVADGSYTPFELVTVGADAQTVDRFAYVSGNEVGYIVCHAPVVPRSGPAATPVPETVPGGTAAELWLKPAFPTAALL